MLPAHTCLFLCLCPLVSTGGCCPEQAGFYCLQVERGTAAWESLCTLTELAQLVSSGLGMSVFGDFVP